MVHFVQGCVACSAARAVPQRLGADLVPGAEPTLPRIALQHIKHINHLAFHIKPKHGGRNHRGKHSQQLLPPNPLPALPPSPLPAAAPSSRTCRKGSLPGAPCTAHTAPLPTMCATAGAEALKPA